MNSSESAASINDLPHGRIQSPSLGDFEDFLDKRKLSFHKDATLSEYTTFRLGGHTPYLVECGTPEAVTSVIAELARLSLGFELIGDGSNLLISDEGISHIVVCYSCSASIHREGQYLTVTGGTRLDDLAEYTVDQGLGGVVNCSGIPGTVGGAIAGNAGAFGWQIADCLSTLDLINRRGEVRSVTGDNIEFGYRYSELQKTRDIVLSARLKLSDYCREALCRERERILELRASKHPDLTVDSCAGSFFKNIEPTSAAQRRQAAGWFLDQAEARSMVVGGAGVYEKHANIIIKKNPECTAQDVYKLSVLMSEEVDRIFGIQLKREVKLLGDF